MISWLTKILDEALTNVESEIYNKYGTAEFPIKGIKISSKDVIFVAAANSNHFVLTDGLKRRLRSSIAFPAMTLEKKREIATAHADELEQKSVAAVLAGTLEPRIEALKLKAGANWQTSAAYQNELQRVRLSVEEKAQVQFIATRNPFPSASTMKDTINKWYGKRMGNEI